MPAPAGTPGYDRVATGLHWIIGIALIAQISFGFLLDDLAPRGTPTRGSVINLHKSIGIVLGLSILVRLGWRLAHRVPEWPASMSAGARSAARIGHAALYVCMVLMPASGYIASNFSKHGVRFFGTALPPWGPDLPSVYGLFNLVHVVTGWVFAALIAGHVLAALKHALIDRDGIFQRVSLFRASRTSLSPSAAVTAGRKESA